MKLTYDALYAVMEAQNFEDDLGGLSSMTRTCTILRNMGLKHLLDRKITLRSDRDASSFSLFILSDEERRLPMLQRCLSLETGHLSPDAASALVDLVSKISHLERLVLVDADHILASDPRLPHALAALTCLKHLEFSAAEDSDNSDCVYMIRKLRSRLLTASLHLPTAIRRYVNGHVNCELIDPIGLLRGSASTLVEVSGTNFEARRHFIVYPQVERLKIQFGLIPELTPYIQSFPNITAFDVTCGASFDPSTLPSFRMMNEEAQQRVGCWPVLEELTGRLTDLYILSLASQITSLHVRATRKHGVLSHLTDVMSRARPTDLRLEVDTAAFHPTNAEETLATVLHASGAALYVRTLDLRIVLQGKDRQANLDELFSCVIEAIELLPLTSFKVEIDHKCGDAETYSEASSAFPELQVDAETVAELDTAKDEARSALEQMLHNWDATRHVEHIRRACPSLRELVIGPSCAVVFKSV